MKKSIAACMLLVASAAHGWELDHSKNPDQRASVAVEVTNGSLLGRGVNTEYLYSRSQNTNVPTEDSILGEVTSWSVSPSVRLPMTNNLTIDIGATLANRIYDYAGSFTRLHGKLKGEIYSVGFRYYLQD